MGWPNKVRAQFHSELIVEPNKSRSIILQTNHDRPQNSLHGCSRRNIVWPGGSRAVAYQASLAYDTNGRSHVPAPNEQWFTHFYALYRLGRSHLPVERPRAHDLARMFERRK